MTASQPSGGPPPRTMLRLLLRFRRVWQVLRDTVVGAWGDGFVHAGNLAYLSLLTLFPSVIVVATVAGALGRTDDGLRAVASFLHTLPPDVALLVAKPISDVVSARASSGLLTLGIVVTLWSVSGFVETIRAIIRGAYKTPGSLPVWRYRAGSIVLVVAAVLLLIAAFAAQVLLTGAASFVDAWMPLADEIPARLGLQRLLPDAVLFIALYAIFYVLTPPRYRISAAPIWPGALLTATVWTVTTALLPVVLGLFGGYTLTYGSLAGVIVALLFFYIIGFGIVVGAHLNAALAKRVQSRLKAGGAVF